MMNADLGKDFSYSDYYRALFDNPKKNSVLMLDENGIILDVNRAFQLSFGYDRIDLIGQHFSILFTEEDRQRDLPMREVRTVLDEAQSYDNNYLVNKNGVLTWVSGESVLLNNAQGRKCILKVIQNIHTQKESEQSIVRLNNFNENILASIDDAVLVMDPDLNLVKANRSFVKLFNLTEPFLHTFDFPEFLKRFDTKGGLQAAIESAFGTGSCASPLELEFEDAYSRLRSFEVTCGRLDGQSGQTHALLIFHDVTTKKDQERQRDDILNFVAHELRNPLTNIMLNIGWMDAQMQEKSMEGFADFIDRVKRNAERLKKLVNELYKSTKLISGNYDLQTEAFDLDEFVDDCVGTIRMAYPEFTIERKGLAKTTLTADRDKLLQVLTNYLTNATKYSDGNTYIQVGVVVREGWATVSVADGGKGIPAKELPYIFNRFYRAEKTRNLEGLGIGLFLSRQIIEVHKGRTWVESIEGEGSTFYFSLPVAL